ncbi:hypothetical protein MHTCC0001_37190 [Flavobacteriaceae bacterium MHTCC 0001]
MTTYLICYKKKREKEEEGGVEIILLSDVPTPTIFFLLLDYAG